MAVLCVVNTGPMLIAVTTITEMVILYKYVEIIIIITLYVHVVLNCAICPQILYDIVLYVPHFLLSSFFPSVTLIKYVSSYCKI